MGEIARSGRTVIFVSHNMMAIESLCNRVLWLVDGELVEKAETEKVVSDYVNTNVSVSTEKVWDDPSTAPGDELIKLHSAKLRSLAQQNSEEFSVETPIEIQFEFWNYQEGAKLHFIIHLLTVGGVHVFSAVSELKDRRRGLVRETIMIPANLLNHGMYAISVQAVQDIVTALYPHPDVLIFELLDSCEWRRTWPGVVRPRLEWVSEDIGGGLPL